MQVSNLNDFNRTLNDTVLISDVLPLLTQVIERIRVYLEDEIDPSIVFTFLSSPTYPPVVF